MTRLKLCCLWLLCALVTPILLVAMLVQALLGSAPRAQRMAVAYDECGNCLLGGEPTVTISTRTGNALIQGKRWAKIAAPCIDALFGAGHCLANATLPH
ncbi:hypothetical protein BCh11DRAFT_00248 [Burkholderia sp. Ch1-1]|nr:hypothetical protein BCh11DRAFT_00248 [Burkholderia sp. Ch1-1]